MIPCRERDIEGEEGERERARKRKRKRKRRRISSSRAKILWIRDSMTPVTR
jgi:hypothetical protein